MTLKNTRSAKNRQNRGNFDSGLVFIWLPLTNDWDSQGHKAPEGKQRCAKYSKENSTRFRIG